MSSDFDLELFKLFDLADAQFDDLPANCFDFTTHLKPDVAMTKKVERRGDGRPVYVHYLYEGELYARIYFLFKMNAEVNLMTERCVVLKQVLKETGPQGEILFGPDVLLKKTIWNLADETDLQASVEEAEDARKSLVAKMKGFTQGVLQFALGATMTLSEIKTMVKLFWDDSQIARNHFIELATDDFKVYMENADTITYGWLLIPVDGFGTTLQDYLIATSTYDSSVSKLTDDNIDHDMGNH